MPAQPAQPLLASTLFNLHNARNNHCGGTKDQTPPSAPRKRRKLETGWKGIDRDVLQGGLDYGEGGIVCLSASGGDEGVAGLCDEVSGVRWLFVCFELMSMHVYLYSYL